MTPEEKDHVMANQHIGWLHDKMIESATDNEMMIATIKMLMKRIDRLESAIALYESK